MTKRRSSRRALTFIMPPVTLAESPHVVKHSPTLWEHRKAGFSVFFDPTMKVTVAIGDPDPPNRRRRPCEVKIRKGSK